jgi:GntR family transcriptional regulator, transcriptional repressor for pyruvate dehydrogenase complex
MDLKPIKTKKIYEEIVEQIKQLMAAGNLKPGDKLLSERELAEQLQVSRASVREAIRSLEMMAFVDIKPGEGTFVRNPNTDEIILPLAMFLAVEKSSLLDMLEIRRVFESAAAGMAAERASEDEIDQIRAAYEHMKESINVHDSEKGEEYDTLFHYSIAEATHNNLLIRLFRTISEDFSRSISAARRQLFLDEHNPQIILDQHRRIYEAIKERNPKKASSTMLEHLTFAEQELNKKMVKKTAVYS